MTGFGVGGKWVYAVSKFNAVLWNRSRLDSLRGGKDGFDADFGVHTRLMEFWSTCEMEGKGGQ